MPVKPNWVKRALQSLTTSSRVDLSGEAIDDLGLLGQLTVMRTLDLSCVPLSSISNLKPNLQLETFIADNSQLSSFTNFSSISNIRKLSLLRTPISQEPNFILSALVICPNLTSVNGKQPPPLLRQRAANYPEVARQFVNAGWFVEFPYPTEQRIAALCTQYNIDLPTSDLSSSEVTGEEQKVEPDKFEDTLKMLWQEHHALVRRVRRAVRLTAADDRTSTTVDEDGTEGGTTGESSIITDSTVDNDEVGEHRPLLERLVGLLKEHGIQLDDLDWYGSVLHAVDTLCVEHADKVREVVLESE
jgi:hypothetical protein